MVRDDSTAEKELLKAIEGDPSVVKPLKTASGQDSISALKSKIAFLTDGLKSKIANAEFKLNTETLKNIPKISLSIVFVLYVIIFIKGVNRMHNIPRFEISQEITSDTALNELQMPLKEYSYYSDIILGRNIFSEATAAEIKTAIATSAIKDMTKDLQLVGLSWSTNRNEKFVMLEDKSTQVTYFLQEGDTVLDLLIKAIHNDRVVLAYGNEEIDLR